MKKRTKALIGIFVGIIMILLGIWLLNDYSFPLIGIALIIISISVRSCIIELDSFRTKERP